MTAGKNNIGRAPERGNHGTPNGRITIGLQLAAQTERTHPIAWETGHRGDPDIDSVITFK